MPLISNAALAFDNIFDNAALGVSTAASLLPASNLKLPDIATKWRGTGGSAEYITATFATPQSIDTLAVMGLGSTFLSSGTGRLRLSNVALGGTDILDHGPIAGLVDPKYGYLIFLLPQVYSGWRYAYLDLSQTGASYIEAGRVFMGTRTQFTYNYAPGASRQWKYNTRKVKSSGGQTKIDRASPGKYRVVDFNLGWVDETQRWALHEAMDIANGDHTDVLFIGDPTSTNLGRDSVWGLVNEVSPVTQPFTIGDLYSRQMQIEERL